MLRATNILLSTQDQISLNIFKGCFCQIEERWNIKYSQTNRESGDADMPSVEVRIPALQDICNSYKPDDICNEYQTGMQYKIPPDPTISGVDMEGWMKGKVPLTLLIGCNYRGTYLYESLIIGTAPTPRCFQKQTGKCLYFDYAFNKKS